jgi:hypothetical protein
MTFNLLKKEKQRLDWSVGMVQVLSTPWSAAGVKAGTAADVTGKAEIDQVKVKVGSAVCGVLQAVEGWQSVRCYSDKDQDSVVYAVKEAGKTCPSTDEENTIYMPDFKKIPGSCSGNAATHPAETLSADSSLVACSKACKERLDCTMFELIKTADASKTLKCNIFAYSYGIAIDSTVTTANCYRKNIHPTMCKSVNFVLTYETAERYAQYTYGGTLVKESEMRDYLNHYKEL